LVEYRCLSSIRRVLRFCKTAPVASRDACRSGSYASRTKATLRKPQGQERAHLNTASHRVFERSMPPDLIRGWGPIRVKKTRQSKNLELSVLIQSEPIMLWFQRQPTADDHRCDGMRNVIGAGRPSARLGARQMFSSPGSTNRGKSLFIWRFPNSKPARIRSPRWRAPLRRAGSRGSRARSAARD
jgi:hypothetical protein